MLQAALARAGRLRHVAPTAAWRGSCAAPMRLIGYVGQRQANVEIVDAHTFSMNGMRVNSRWFRSTCQCPRCIMPGTSQRVETAASVALSPNKNEMITLASVSSEPDNTIVARFNDGHEVRTDAALIAKLSNRRVPAYRPPHSPKTNAPSWSGTTLTMEEIATPFDAFMTDSAALFNCLRRFRKHGLFFLTGAPSKEKTVSNIGTRIGALRNTFYGLTWDVKSKSGANNIAYTEQMLGMHQDLLYFDTPPFVQILHCLSPSDKGGETVFTDGHRAINELYSLSPRFYSLLSSQYIYYHFEDSDSSRGVQHRVIESTRQGYLRSINFSPPFEGIQSINHQCISSFYEAYDMFAMLVEQPEHSLAHRLQTGEVVIFNNRRILHARRPFESSKRVRWLRGAYVDHEEVDSRMKVLFRELNLKQTP